MERRQQSQKCLLLRSLRDRKVGNCLGLIGECTVGNRLRIVHVSLRGIGHCLRARQGSLKRGNDIGGIRFSPQKPSTFSSSTRS